MPTITPSTIYWITRLDGIRSLISSFSIICCVLGASALVVFVLWATDRCTPMPRVFKRLAICFIPLAFILAAVLDVVNTFIPTTKETAAIYMIPAVANNAKVQSIAAESLDSVSGLIKLSNTWVQEQLAAPKASK